MIDLDDLFALSQTSRETIGLDVERAIGWATDMGIDVEAIRSYSRLVASDALRMLVSGQFGTPADLNEIIAGAWGAGFEMGVRAENLRQTRERLGPL